MFPDPSAIRSIVFDLDGTLYVCPQIAAEIERAAVALVAATRGVDFASGRDLLNRARRRLSEMREEDATLSQTCLALGIELPDFHRALQEGVHPERYLEYDGVLVALLDSLSEHCALYVYTNNNLALTHKILALLGIQPLFSRIYTIEFTGRPKPDKEAFFQVLDDIGGAPESFLFVGDREAVDLRVAAAQGCPTLLVRETADLLQIHKHLGLIP
ncbi:HAD family hydrolase [Geoalkalibacter halelectricus]|uniref:phosphoglycolate phosphatase n=1 Tax=Geoalkalibacter halelectricus TaxID=2847045 RepID=A0ABY5ZUT9_9BACT|nr:HAD family hydrolase [Geoalkalibacter halelectricus]MDO3379218.1 HAD family hydrolase [Geoalkalibacter halelectricus]UWZ80976.1 HAD family hydrolase [Geoalkalibacter halelectricus]